LLTANIINTLELSLNASVFHVGLLFVTLASLKLHTKNYLCMFIQLIGTVTHNSVDWVWHQVHTYRLTAMPHYSSEPYNDLSVICICYYSSL